MIFNMQKCILNYYTSVKVGSYSIETICTGSYSIETLFFGIKKTGSYSIETPCIWLIIPTQLELFNKTKLERILHEMFRCTRQTLALVPRFVGRVGGHLTDSEIPRCPQVVCLMFAFAKALLSQKSLRKLMLNSQQTLRYITLDYRV